MVAERMTVALRSGLPLSVKRWQRYKEIPKPARDFGKKWKTREKMGEFPYKELSELEHNFSS